MLNIIQGDCVVILDDITDESIDVVVCSPPYNINKKYLTYEDNLPYQDYLSWMYTVFQKIYRVLKPNGSFFLNIGSICKKPFIHMDVCQEARKIFILQNDIAWIKSVSIFDQNWRSYGHFKPINSDRFLNQQHESIFHFTKNGNVKIDRLAVGVPYQDKSNIDRWKHEDKVKSDKRCRGNVWYIPYQTVHSQKSHPAGYPVELVENCIKLHGLTDDLIVLDPFLGAGTTLVAAKKMNINGIGIELDAEYCKIAQENIS